MKKYLVPVILGFAILLIAAASYMDLISFELIKQEQQALQTYYKNNPIICISIFAALYYLVIALSIPIASLLTVAAGMIFGLILGVLIVSIASTLGACTSFLIARYALRDYFINKFRETYERIDAGFQKEGAFYLLTLRLIPTVPFWLINIGMGLSSMRLLTYAWVSQLGMLAGTCVYVNAGTEIARLDSLADIISPALIISFILLALLPLLMKYILALIKRTYHAEQMSARKKIIITSIIVLSTMLFIAGISAWLSLRPIKAPYAGPPPQEHGQYDAEIHQGADKQYYFLSPALHTYKDFLLHIVDSEGYVRYNDYQKHKHLLESYVNSIAYLDPERYQQWSENRQLCFWINAYNALTLHVVSEEFPIGTSLFGFGQNILGHDIPRDSIRQLAFLWQQTEFLVMRQRMTLDHIEHQILRKDFSEARIHMAINCASVGCPTLRQEAYVHTHIDEQLEAQTREFLLQRDVSKIIIDRTNNTVTLSSILDWFAEDFIPGNNASEAHYKSAQSKAERAVLVFVSRYLNADDADYLRTQSYSIIYAKYDWNLNISKQTPP